MAASFQPSILVGRRSMHRYFGGFVLENQDFGGGIRNHLKTLKVFHENEGLDLLYGELSE